MNPSVTMPDGYVAARLDLHWAAQLPAAGSTLLPASDDFSHTALEVVDGHIASARLPGGRRILLGSDLKLRVGDEQFRLEEQTIDIGMEFLRDQLGKELERPEHDLPERPLSAPLRSHSAHATIFAWFKLARYILDRVADREAGGPVRLWPHHFDMATLLELDDNPRNPEKARSINVGFSPGDARIAEPYWYVTPWPRPSKKLPPLKRGQWHTDGFCAAVFRASEHRPDDVNKDARRFMRQAIAACHKLLGTTAPPPPQ